MVHMLDNWLILCIGNSLQRRKVSMMVGILFGLGNILRRMFDMLSMWHKSSSLLHMDLMNSFRSEKGNILVGIGCTLYYFRKIGKLGYIDSDCSIDQWQLHLNPSLGPDIARSSTGYKSLHYYTEDSTALLYYTKNIDSAIDPSKNNNLVHWKVEPNNFSKNHFLKNMHNLDCMEHKRKILSKILDCIVDILIKQRSNSNSCLKMSVEKNLNKKLSKLCIKRATKCLVLTLASFYF